MDNTAVELPQLPDAWLRRYQSSLPTSLKSVPHFFRVHERSDSFTKPYLLDPLVPVIDYLLNGSIGGRRIILELELKRNRLDSSAGLVEERKRDGRTGGSESDRESERELRSGTHDESPPFGGVETMG